MTGDIGDEQVRVVRKKDCIACFAVDVGSQLLVEMTQDAYWEAEPVLVNDHKIRRDRYQCATLSSRLTASVTRFVSVPWGKTSCIRLLQRELER